MFIEKKVLYAGLFVALLAASPAFTSAQRLRRTQAQQYDVASIQTYDLGKPAAYADRTQPVAPIAARPGGGAYIQWAEQQDWNNGKRCSEDGKVANSKVFVTEVDNDGNIVSTRDIELGRSQPAGIVATDSSFGYYIVDGDKLTFGIGDPGSWGGRQTVVMDHRQKGICDPRERFKPYPRFRSGRGLRFPERNNNQVHWTWQIPYLPDGGSLAYGNGQFGTGFSYWNNFYPSEGTDDAHTGDAFLFFDNSGNNPRMPMARTDHSSDQRIVFDETNRNFYSISLAYDLRLREYDGQGTLGYNKKPLTDPDTKRGVPYTDAQRGTIPDIPYEGEEGNKLESAYGLGNTAMLGDLHPLGGGMLALTYGVKPSHHWFPCNNKHRVKKNQVDFALINDQGKITLRKVIFQANGRAGQDGYTEYHPFEQVRWVKSAKVGSGNNLSFMIFFQTETLADSTKKCEANSYKPASVRMVQVDAQGNILQGPVTLPDTAKFNRGDRIAVLSDGTMAWTHTGYYSLKLSLFPPPGKSLAPPAAPEPAPARKWRLFTTKDSLKGNGFAWDVNYIAMYESSDCTSDGINVPAKAEDYYSSGNYKRENGPENEFGPENAFDGKRGNWWGDGWPGRQNSGQFWIGVTFRSDEIVRCVNLNQLKNHATQVLLQFSNDGASWTTVATGKNLKQGDNTIRV